MKIFDWVHRRLNTNLEYCRVPRRKDVYGGSGGLGGEGEGQKKAEKEAEDALLLELGQVTSIHHVLDGILTIGTLGRASPLHHLHHHQENPNASAIPTYASEEEEEEEEREEQQQEEEEIVLEETASTEQRDHPLAIDSFQRKNMEGEVKISDNRKVEGEEEKEDLLEPLLKEMKDEKKERITLADLFLASDDDHGVGKDDPAGRSTPAGSGKIDSLKKEMGGANKTVMVELAPVCIAKHGRSLAKKLSPWKKGGGEDSPPTTKKLHRLIRRMLKRKIHPEMAHESVAAGMLACGGEHLTDSRRAEESVTLY